MTHGLETVFLHSTFPFYLFPCPFLSLTPPFKKYKQKIKKVLVILIHKNNRIKCIHPLTLSFSNLLNVFQCRGHYCLVSELRSVKCKFRTLILGIWYREVWHLFHLRLLSPLFSFIPLSLPFLHFRSPFFFSLSTTSLLTPPYFFFCDHSPSFSLDSLSLFYPCSSPSPFPPLSPLSPSLSLLSLSFFLSSPALSSYTSLIIRVLKDTKYRTH